MIIDKMKQLVIGDKVAQLPIVQGGMGIGISMSRLASSVANEGGIGVISAAGVGLFEKNQPNSSENYLKALKDEIQKTRLLTRGIIGVNIMVALTNFHELAKTAIESKIDIIFAGAGLPLDLPNLLKESDTTKLVPIVSSGRAAKIIIQKWVKNYQYLPDAFVIEGPLAGGHLGVKKEMINHPDHSLESIFLEVKESIKPYESLYHHEIPLIVGGGVYDGKDILHYLSLGANAVQMATRFVTTEECDASQEFKQTYIDANKDDIVIIESPVGLPGRAIRNKFLDDVEKGLKHPFACPFNCISTCKKEEAPYCISLALHNARKGNFKNGFAFAGANAYLSKKIITVKELFNTLISEYQNAFSKQFRMT